MALFGEYEDDKAKIKDFLQGFYTSSGKPGQGKEFKYAKRIQSLAHRESVELVAELDDLVAYDDENEKLAEHIEKNCQRYTLLLSQAVAELIPDFRTREAKTKDHLDIYIEHRLKNARRVTVNQEDPEQDAGQNAPNLEAQFPPELMRRFEAYWKPRSAIKPLGIRALRGDQIGKLVTIHGVIIRASEVRPLCSVATYLCDSCSAETYQAISGPSFTPLSSCVSEFCKSNRTGGRLQLQTRGSKFVRFQELKIQEQSGDVPAGHVPRSLTVHCKGENTRRVTAGDHVSVSGVFLPLSKSTAYAQIAGGLLTDTYLEAHRVSSISKWDEGEMVEELTDEEIADYSESNFYEKLAASIAPEVYGHEDVKKSLLLQLVGGVDKNVGGLRIRGTVNICLMGDPGVAKSQLLSYVDRLAPRSQLTSGRGSSGVGLTASIMKDPVTGLMTLEAGALMLADQGICCIDEFDKMSDSDRTSLHEVMEQQTISVAKAGILTTLHARTSILAAANPAYGRYNPNRPIQENINLPAALLSRFDILWLLQDKADQTEDLRLAKHIAYVHQHLHEPPTTFKPMDMGLMRRYIMACKRRNPVVPPTLSERLVGAYVELRNEARNMDIRNTGDKTFTSPRSLLAILRLSTALARLRMSDVVIDDDVNEAIRLVERSRDSLKPGSTASATNARKTTSEKIYEIIRRYKETLKSDMPSISVKDFREKVFNEGHTREELDRCLDEYEGLNIWQLNTNKTKLTFVF